MRIHYAVIATLLAGSMLALPAMAGVTDTTGGTNNSTSSTDKHTTIVNKYQDIEKAGTNTVVNKTKTNTTNNYTVVGHLKYHEKSAHQHGSYGNYWYTDENANLTFSASASDSNLQAVKAQMENTLADWKYSRWSGRTGGGCSYNGGSWNVRSNTVENSRSTTSNTVVTGYTYGQYGLTDSKTVKDNTDSSTTVTYGGNSIVIGDPDSLANNYVAQGSVSSNTKVDEYYTQTDTYSRDKLKNTKTTNTTTINKTNNVTYEINASRNYSPIVLDLNADGKIEASNGKYLPHLESFEANKLAMFDFYGNGFPVLTEWVGRYDGLLCRPNADGTVNGTNLFGTANGFQNGYDEMASLDANNSGSLEGAELDNLRVWIDENGDAVSTPQELHTLAELGISSISVNHNNFKSSFVRHGNTYDSFDWWPNIKDVRKVDLDQRFSH